VTVVAFEIVCSAVTVWVMMRISNESSFRNENSPVDKIEPNELYRRRAEALIQRHPSGYIKNIEMVRHYESVDELLGSL